MNNKDFLKTITDSFKSYMNVGTSRSTAKLKALHGNIAKDIEKKLGRNFTVRAQGHKEGKEGILKGRYYEKKSDITIYNQKDEAIAGFALKFVVRNYSQNSNNYFENMLGETANIRSNKIPYFQIFIIFDKIPYYQKGGTFKKWDILTFHNLQKYITLSLDNPCLFFHTPNKTLLVILHLKEDRKSFKNEEEYAKYYKAKINDSDFLTYSNICKDALKTTTKSNTIFNDYEKFINKTCHFIKSI